MLFCVGLDKDCQIVSGPIFAAAKMGPGSLCDATYSVG